MKTTDLLPYLKRIQWMQIQYLGRISIYCFAHLGYDGKPFLTMSATNPDDMRDNISMNIYPFYSQETVENVMSEFEHKVEEYLQGIELN